MEFGAWKLAYQSVIADIVKGWMKLRESQTGENYVHTNPIEMTNKMQLCRTIYYSIVPWLLNMFRAIL